MTRTNRRTLRNAAAKGHLYVKCSYSMTDDYAYDAAIKFGKMDLFVKAALRTECEEAESRRDTLNRCWDELSYDEKEHMQAEIARLRREHRRREDDANPGCVWFHEGDFRGKGGHMKGDKKSGYFNVHRNLSYEYQIRKDEPVVCEAC